MVLELLKRILRHDMIDDLLDIRIILTRENTLLADRLIILMARIHGNSEADDRIVRLPVIAVRQIDRHRVSQRIVFELIDGHV